ncbi:amidase [Prauserella sediminis]|uniref:Amidase n=1 Tax=Prauserella sediminis TaxID=577680 RepID=A0A839XP57_9PSEU|nr:amidase [Prauserella sediminis]MBB3664531.1 amidase [Prauserella sediminis]
MSEDPYYWTATRQAEAVRRREVSATELVTLHLDRIEQVNAEVNAVVSVDAEAALDAARKADDIVMSGRPLGALHGLPIAHKDTLELAGWRTTHGSTLLASNVPERTQIVVERTRAAGAISVGRTNVPEFGAGSHTVNAVYGATRNPYDLDRSAGGSSGGAAAALASGMIPIADGSDTGGSLRNPASFNNVVGLRPSAGRVPTWPDSMAWGQISVKGPLARTVEDLRLLLGVMAGPDPRSPLGIHTDNPRFEYESAVRGLRIAWAPSIGGIPVDRDVVDALTATVSELPDRLGCHVELDEPDLTGADDVFLTLRAWHMTASLGGLVERHADQIGDSVRWNVEIGRSLSGADIARAEAGRTELFHRMREFFERYDLLVAPTSQIAPFPVELDYPRAVGGVEMDTYLDWMKSAYLISPTGSPALSVPGGFTEAGLPVGLQVIGPYRREERLFPLAAAIEEQFNFGARRPAFCRGSLS